MESKVQGRRELQDATAMWNISRQQWQVGPLADQWTAPHRVRALGQRSTPGVSLERARDDIERRIRDHLSRDEPGLLVVGGVPGVGKTTITRQVAEQVANETGTHIAWFASRHDLFGTVEPSQGWVHTQGRHSTTHKADGSLVLGNCQQAHIAGMIGGKGWPVCDSLCPRCPDRATCSWWQQWQGDHHRFMPSEHLQAAAFWDRPGLRLVLDEVGIAHLAPATVVADLNAIAEWKEVWPELTVVLDVLLTFVSANGHDNSLADTPLYEQLSPLLPDVPVADLVVLEMPARGQADLSSWAESLPDARAADLLTTLYQERARHLRGRQFVSRIAISQGKMIYYPPPRVPEEVFKHPAVLLNATIDVQALMVLSQNPPGVVDIRRPNVGLHPETKVHYVLDANHSKTTVRRRGDGYTRRWLERVRDAVSDSERTLVIATAEGEHQLSQALSDLVAAGHVVLAHYGAVSGLNEYQDCDQVVLTQPFNPSPDAVAGAYRCLYGGTPGDPLDLKACSRTLVLDWSDEQGMTWEVTVTSMRDERLAPIHERWRWAEMYQAAHRVRPVLHRRRIVVMCAIPLVGLEPTAVSYSNRRWRTMERLRVAARKILREADHFTRRDLAREARVDESTVSRHWSDLIESEGLRIIEIAVRSPRYPGGRIAEAATA